MKFISKRLGLFRLQHICRATKPIFGPHFTSDATEQVINEECQHDLKISEEKKHRKQGGML